MLEQDALRYYYKKFPIIVDYPVVIADHYYLIMRRDGILFHAQSVITFCHRFNPEQFNELTSRTMRKAFPRYSVVSGKGLCLSFRQITEAEFNEIVGG